MDLGGNWNNHRSSDGLHVFTDNEHDLSKRSAVPDGLVADHRPGGHHQSDDRGDQMGGEPSVLRFDQT